MPPFLDLLDGVQVDWLLSTPRATEVPRQKQRRRARARGHNNTRPGVLLQIGSELGGEHGDARFRVARRRALRHPRDFRNARDVLQ